MEVKVYSSNRPSG